MAAAPIPECETERLEALRAYEVLDTPPEAAFERIVALATALTGAPMAAVSLVDADRQWFKARCGLGADQTCRDVAFCAHAILTDDVLAVPDATQDPRFADNPLVVGPPGVRAYAGAPLINSDGLRLGALCAIWDEPVALPPSMLAQLQNLAAIVVDELELRLALRWAEAARDRATALNQAKRQFLAMISHELRTPLNSVLGMAAALENTALDDAQRRMTGVIAEAGDRLLELLNDILNLSTAELDAIQLDDVEFELSELMGGLEAAFRGSAERKGLDFTIQIEDAADGVYRGDVRYVGQILAHLVKNAVKFTHVGGVTVEVARGASAAASDRRDCIFTVRDTGIGISEAERTEIFAQFVQGDGSLTRRYGGLGLGLAICERLCAAMGGRISVDSRPGRGSAFRVTLPLTPVRPAREVVDRGSPPGDAAVRILAAEDHETNRAVLAALLGQSGLACDFAHDGREAVEAWARGGYDIILMDIQMPNMDGMEATRRIREHERERGLAPTPIIAVTANTMPEQVRAQKAAGVDQHLSKPYRPEELIRAILTAARRAA